MKEIPVTLLTGFLGSGKTRLRLDSAGSERFELHDDQVTSVGIHLELCFREVG